MRSIVRSLLAATALCSLPALLPASANAFCGFYVAKADTKLFNKASKVVVARKGERTAVTLETQDKPWWGRIQQRFSTASSQQLLQTL